MKAKSAKKKVDFFLFLLKQNLIKRKVKKIIAKLQKIVLFCIVHINVKHFITNQRLNIARMQKSVC